MSDLFDGMDDIPFPDTPPPVTEDNRSEPFFTRGKRLTKEQLLQKQQEDEDGEKHKIEVDKLRSQSLMDREEVMCHICKIKNNTASTRQSLLKIHAAKGWFAMDHPTMEQFAKKELGISRPTLFRILNQYEIDIILFGTQSPIGDCPQIPEGHTRELTRLKTVLVKQEKPYEEPIREVYQRAIAQSKVETYKEYEGKPNPLTGKPTARIIANEVNRYLGLPPVPKAKPKKKGVIVQTFQEKPKAPAVPRSDEWEPEIVNVVVEDGFYHVYLSIDDKLYEQRFPVKDSKP